MLSAARTAGVAACFLGGEGAIEQAVFFPSRDRLLRNPICSMTVKLLRLENYVFFLFVFFVRCESALTIFGGNQSHTEGGG